MDAATPTLPLLAAGHPQSLLTVAGRISLIDRRDLYGTGVIGVETVRGRRRRYWARLTTPGDYAEAVRAHGENLVLRVTGYYLQEGGLRWLLNATVVEVLGRAEPRDRPLQQSPADQLVLFSIDSWSTDSSQPG